MILIGVDIGGTHISCIAVDSDTGEFYKDSFSENKIINSEGASNILKVWSSTIQKSIHAIDNSELAGIGIAMPGPFDYKNGISAILGLSKYHQLMGLDIRYGLQSELKLPEHVSLNFINDAFAFGIGEAWQGEGIRKDKIVAITLGTGFGSAFIRKGIPVVKGSTVPKYGYMYHVPFKNTIAEEYVSERWFKARYKEVTGRDIRGVREMAKDVGKDPAIAGIFVEFGENVAFILYPWLKKFEAEMLVIGGNISGASELFLPALSEYLMNKKMNIDIKVSRLKEKATFLGCSRLGDEDFYHEVETSLY